MNKQLKFYTSNDLNEIKQLINDVDINWQNKNDNNNTILMSKCNAIFENDADIAKFLLTVPSIDVNLVNEYQESALIIAGWNTIDEIIELLINDNRTDLSKKDVGNKTILWHTCFNGNIQAIKRLLANGKFLNVNQKTNDMNSYDYESENENENENENNNDKDKNKDKYKNMTAVEVARINNNNECAELLEAYIKKPHETIQKMRKEINWIPTEAAVLVQILFVCDGLLEIESTNKMVNNKRFFKIAESLHYDLQLVLANRTYGLAYNNISLDDRLKGFTSIIKMFE